MVIEDSNMRPFWMHTFNNVENDRWQMPSVCINISGLQKSRLCIYSDINARLILWIWMINKWFRIYTRKLLSKAILADYWWYGYFLPAAGIEPATSDVYTCRHSDIRDSVLCSGLHNLSYYTFLSHLFLLLIVRITQSEMLSLNLLLCFVASCTCPYII